MTIHWSEDDAAYIARVPEFPLLSAFGETRQKAVEEAELVLQAILATMAEDGDTFPKPLLLKSKFDG
jgi:predicted RNase H-like HicB family nuclease